MSLELKYKIKVCGMRDPNNIRDLVKLPINFVGFIFYPKSNRYVGDEPNEEIFKLVPKTIKKVGVFVNEKLEKVIARAKLFDLDYVQLHGKEDVEYCKELRKHDIKIIKVFSMKGEFDFSHVKKYEDVTDYFLFDTASANHGGTGKKFDWEILNTTELNKPFFLAGGIGPEDADLVKSLQLKNLYALDLNSRFEVLPANKDIPKLMEFLVKIR